MEFGISLDPSSVPQRHALYDSDEEEDEQADSLKPDFVIQPLPCPDSKHKSHSLLLAIGPTACIFAKSHFILSPFSTIMASTQTIFQGMYFPKSEKQSCLVSELLYADGGDVIFCLQENILKVDHVNTWSKKVSLLFFGCMELDLAVKTALFMKNARPLVLIDFEPALNKCLNMSFEKSSQELLNVYLCLV